MTKKKDLTKEDKEVWENFTKQPSNIYDKEQDNKKYNSRRVQFNYDLHGFTLEDANQKVKEIILSAVDNKYKEILLITGKGLHSTTDDDALVQALMYGEEADVRNVVATLRNGNNGQQASPQQMAMMAAKIAQEQLAQQQVLNNALEEYPEVKNDPILQQVAGRFYLDEVKQDLMSLGYTEQQLNAAPVQQWNERHAEARAKNYGSVRSYDQLLRTAGAKARDWKTGGSATPTDGLAEKQSRKAGVAKQPRSISAATPNRGEPRPLSQADIIREEREARNLPVY